MADAINEWANKADELARETLRMQQRSAEFTAGYELPEGVTLADVLGALRKAHHEINAIRARDGAPLSIQWNSTGPMQSFQCDEDYFNEVVEDCSAILAAFTKEDE